MKLSENGLKWMMRLYPPMFFQRIWVKRVFPGFRGIEVKINRSIFTTNLGNSIFGGTIFAASDPFYALLFGQILRTKGYKISVWLKSAQIQYLKPARTDSYFILEITEGMVQEALDAINASGKFVKAFPIDIKDKSGEIIATVQNEIYVRDLNFKSKNDAVG